jgi:hypothetical protein
MGLNVVRELSWSTELLMSNPSVDVPVPHELQAYAQMVELRLLAVEQELERLKGGMVRPSPSDEQPWWVKIAGSCADNPLFDEAVRYGKEWRNSAE